MKRLVPLRTALLVLVLHSSTGPFTSRSTPSLLCRATPVMVGDDSAPVDVPRRSLWEFSVVWDKLGHFVARLWHGQHGDDDDDCEKRKHLLPGMTSLSANETAITLATRNDSATVTTHRRLVEEEEKEHNKEAELRALKMVHISRARDVTSHERLWAAVIDDDEDKKKHDEGYAYDQTTDTPKAYRITTPGQQPVLVGDIVEHYSSISTVLQDIPEDEDPDTYARNMENPYQEPTLPAPEPPSHPKPGEHTRSPYHSEPAEYTELHKSDKDGGKTIYMTSLKTVTEDAPPVQVQELPHVERGDYAEKEASVSSPHHERQLFIRPEDFKLHAHKHDDKDDKDDDEENENLGGPYYSKDGGLWRRKFKGPKTPQGFPLPGSISNGHHHHLHQHHRQLREQARANMSETELAQIREEAREELVQALRVAARNAEAQRTDLSVANSLEAVMNALAVRRPSVPGLTTGTPATEAKQPDTKGRKQVRLPGDGMQPEVDNPLPPGRERHRLRGLQQAGAAPGAGVGAALVGSFTEAQKAEMRQIFYDATLSMMREAARQALNTNQGGSTGSGSNSMFPSANGKNVGNNVVNQDAYAAALNAMYNAVGSKEMNNANGAIASHSGGPGGVVEGDGHSGGGGGSSAKKQSLLEVAREVARHNSPSAGRPPAAAGRRPNGRRNLRGLKNTIRIPVPYTRDPSSNDTSPIFIHNGTDATYVPLRQVDPSLHLGQVDPSLQEEAFARLGPLGPIMQGVAAIDGERVKETKDGERLGGGQGSVTNPAHPKNHEWAEWLLILVKQHKDKQHWQHEQRTTRNLAESDAAAAPTAANAATTPPAAPAQGDAAAATTTTTATTTTPSLAGSPGMGNAGNPNLDLGALAGLLQHQFVPPVPGGMGQHTQDPATAPQTDALGNIITRMMGPLEAGRKKQEEGKDGEEDKAAKDKKEKKEEGETERPGLGDAFYDRASSQLMSHSASNFQKMQDAVSNIMAQEGIMTWEDGMEGFGE